MSKKFFVFESEAEARKYVADHGGDAKIVYRGEYRHDWLVSFEN